MRMLGIYKTSALIGKGNNNYIFYITLQCTEGSRNIRKSAKVVTMSLEGGGPPVTTFWG